MNVLNKYTAALFLVISVLSHNAVNADKMGSRRPIGQLSKAFKQENLQKVLSGAAWLWSSLGRDTVSYDQGSTTGGNYDYVGPEEDEGEGQEQYPNSSNPPGSGSSSGSGNGGGKKPNQEQASTTTSAPMTAEEQRELNRQLSIAVMRNQLELVTSLLNIRASPNAVVRDGVPVLHYAASWGLYDIVELLLAYGTNVQAVDRDDRTALDVAKSYERHLVASLLASFQESVSAFPGRAGSARPRPEDLSGVQETDQERRGQRRGVFLDPEEFVRKREQYKIQCQLSSAIIIGDIQKIRHLIGEKGANARAFDECGFTPLGLAIDQGHLCIVRYLIEEIKVDANASDEAKLTPLGLAASSGHLFIAKYLIEEIKVNANAPDEHKRTPLGLAARYGNFDIVRYLIEEIDVDTEALDPCGRTPFYWAARFSNWDMVEYLVFKGAIVNPEVPNETINLVVIAGNMDLIVTMMKAEFERRGKKDAQKILMRYMVLNLCLDKVRKPKDDY